MNIFRRRRRHGEDSVPQPKMNTETDPPELDDETALVVRIISDYYAMERTKFRAPDQQDYLLWQSGSLVPWYISKLLDDGNHVGPEVDRACLAAEPEVDLWERGRLYPSWEQTVALARLLDVRVGCLGHAAAEPSVSEYRPDLGQRILWRILSFEPSAVQEAVDSVGGDFSH